jgi:hypothetical protein
MKTLNDYEYQSVESAVGSGATVFSAAVARVYQAQGGKWQLMGTGAIVVLSQTSANSNFIKFIDLNVCA